MQEKGDQAAALWRDRETWQPCRSRASYLDDQVPAFLFALGSLSTRGILRELACIVDWYNQFRPHSWLNGRTPNEVYYGRFPANRKPRVEPRPSWPRSAPCARPWAIVRGSPGAKLTIEVSFHDGKRHLPIVTIKRAA